MKKIIPNWHEEPVDYQEIEYTEAQIGYFFPNLFKKLISKYDELTPMDNIFNFTNIYNLEDERDVNFLSFRRTEMENIFEAQHISQSIHYDSSHLVAFAICANGDYVCFDYSENPKGNNPKIVLVYHDDFEEHEDGTSTMLVNFVANNFEDFMNMLHE